MPNQLINENELQKIEKVINEIKKKSLNGDYIYRGEHRHHCKVSSALYREYFNTYKCIENHEYITNNQDIRVDSMIDFQEAQRVKLKIAKKHIEEQPQDIRDIDADHQTTILNTDEIEILTQLQHYGGETNLIDFTTDYLIAIYFACAGESKADGRVIVLEKTKEIKCMIIPPCNPRHRVIAQKSIFLYPRQGFVNVSNVNIVNIPKDLKKSMITYLRKYHDISVEKIYNDIHGFITSEKIRKNANKKVHLGSSFHLGAFNIQTDNHKAEFFKIATEYYDSAIELDSEASGSYYNRGDCLLHLRQFDKAKKDIMTAKAMGVDIINAFRNHYQNVEKFEDETGVELPPDLAELLGN